MSRKSQKTLHPGNRFNPAIWATRHLQVMLASLGRLSRDPLNTLMTAAVIGIALALPTGMHLLVSNVQILSDQWDGNASISVFLNADVDATVAQQLVDDWVSDDAIESLEYISPETALDEFRQRSGFGEALDLLQENPLPGVILLQPASNHSSHAATERLSRRLQAHPSVDIVQVDLLWLQRLQGITHIIQRGAWVLAVLLACAVLLIVGNTIRLEIQNRRDEIEITKLVGGTRAFVRRPFLYTGFWYGLSGGIIALLLISTSLILLQNPVAHLAGLYGSNFQLKTSLMAIIPGLSIGGGLLGLGGAWIAASQHLNAIEPGKDQ